MGWIIAGIVVYVIYLLVKPKRSKEEKLRQMELEYQQLQEETKIKEMQKALSKKRAEKMGQRLGYAFLLIIALIIYIGIYLGNKEEERVAAMTPEARKAHYAKIAEEKRIDEERRKKERQVKKKQREEKKRLDAIEKEKNRIANLPKELKNQKKSVALMQQAFNRLRIRYNSEGFRMPANYHVQMTAEAKKLNVMIRSAKYQLSICNKGKGHEKLECEIVAYNLWWRSLSRYTTRWNDFMDDI